MKCSRKIEWRQEYDNFVIESVKKSHSKPKWTLISNKFNLTFNENAQGKQIRERYINELDTSVLRTPITKLEKTKITDFVQNYGRKWEILGSQLKRTANSVKNCYVSMNRRINKKNSSCVISIENNTSVNNTSSTKVKESIDQTSIIETQNSLEIKKTSQPIVSEPFFKHSQNDIKFLESIELPHIPELFTDLYY